MKIFLNNGVFDVSLESLDSTSPSESTEGRRGNSLCSGENTLTSVYSSESQSSGREPDLGATVGTGVSTGAGTDPEKLD